MRSIMHTHVGPCPNSLTCTQDHAFCAWSVCCSTWLLPTNKRLSPRLLSLALIQAVLYIQLRIHCGSHTTIEVSSLPIGVVSLAFQGFQLCMQWTRLHNKSPRKQVRKWYSYGNTSTTHTHTHAHMHTHTHTHTHACMHTHARTRTHRHTSVHHVPLGGHTCTQIIN